MSFDALHTALDRTWVEVDLDALAHNARQIRSYVRPGTDIMAVIKADAYGHGAVACARVLLDNGVKWLAVSLLDEALELRAQGIHSPILILNYTDPSRASEIVAHDLSQAAYDWSLLRALSQAAQEQNRVARVHIKMDTGMGRIGFQSSFHSLQEISEMMQDPNIRVEGIFTHFATADEEKEEFLNEQFARFRSLCQELERAGLYIPLKHCCNSAALLKKPQYHLDLVRPGGLLYGFLPACFTPETLPPVLFGEPTSRTAPHFCAVMRFCSRVIHCKEVEAGRSIGYGGAWTAQRKSQIATIPVGYADGYSRALSGKASVLIRGREVPVIGRICMDACMLDVTDLEGGVQIGEEVVLFGRQRKPKSTQVGEISAERFASWMGTIDYEVCTSMGKRVPRTYFREGRLVEVSKSLKL